MSNVLERIVATKQQHIEALKLRFPEGNLTPKTSDRSLYQALSAKGAGFILECKKASPSKGLIRKDFDPVAIADVYSRYASAVSVLTDEAFFQGDFRYLPKVRARIKQPVLCKDFFVSPYQVKLAAHQGADAILLMLSVLSDEQYRLLASEAEQYALDTLTEVSNEEELKRALALGAPIIGINNRNLRDLSTDLAMTEYLAPKIPEGTLIISESGIYSREDVRRLSPLVDGFLVGSSLMAEADLDLACRRLIYGNNKVCGLTREQDLLDAAKSGAVYGGLIFAAKSPRCVSRAHAAELCRYNAEQPRKLAMVGVFVNESPAQMAELANELKLNALQLHGSESSEDIAKLKQLLEQNGHQAEIWKAVPVNVDGGELPALPEGADRYLYDSKSGDSFGGTGRHFDWQQRLAQRERAMLAGGLSPGNAALAATQGFFGLDFNSGVESAPGIKDRAALQAVFKQLKA
ncbi:bifunctional indole-3-glycerol-phosphate synthase TrpC/phosphoribosylanthranilate isomerase TrpF [Shewanella indica]|uniref:bifunctional indole-3-glycerol-phosphate synthase TrpC/phosphoribosylanthranilate isomerase TrpF n=1 Tax=Shewanella TaxID=22 RepID=UPI0008F8BF4E|nr:MULTISPECIES: bifunctional indole-3-glycerol-phosphate synthase TrpC/phosphoribosylanthranilate isomerase TrpF [Shewanella]MCE9793709.1 bifunctional indole-3-glycerol-phosphate synthase TrpC/phosphoribosylanthranilate isomerase TrpF [Shewanella indica]NDO74290.1 bifunctional indole-3-glycerol-phosphate synthase TrpC/phosphoribosylanthranilate isomerase TrpF [Shewanella sp. SE1]OIN07961.1 bifunctional indole-3-glycerol phosphate synthase/phosphoribosylanthranilate isomerase [Shewanella algae]